MKAADPTLSIEPRNTKGSSENIPMLEADQLDIALVAGEPSYQAFMGIGRPRDQTEDLDRDVFQPRHVRGACRQPLQDHSAISSASRLRSAPRAPALPILSRYMLDGIGLKQDEDFKSIYLDHAGEARRWCWTAGPRRCGAPVSAGPASRAGARPRRRTVHRADAGEIARIRAKQPF